MRRERDHGPRGLLAPPELVEQRLVGGRLAGVGVEPAALVGIEDLGPVFFFCVCACVCVRVMEERGELLGVGGGERGE